MSKSLGYSTIPGKLTKEDAVELAKLAKDRNVIQLGCYCGKATIAIALVCKRLWVLDDFTCMGGMDIVQELMRNVKEAGVDDKISFLHGNGYKFTAVADIPHDITMVYKDANRSPDQDNGDAQFTTNVFAGCSGIYAWHVEEILNPVKVGNGGLVAGNHVGSSLRWMRIVADSKETIYRSAPVEIESEEAWRDSTDLEDSTWEVEA